MSREVVKIDEEYTYEFEDGDVFIRHHGNPWILNPVGSKAWISAANEIQTLRAKVESLEFELENRT